MRTAPNQQRAPRGAGRAHFRWEEFERLPRVMRDLINYTPHAVGTGFVYAQLAAGAPLEEVARAAVARWRRYARQETLILYGPDHPQARL